MVYPWVFARIVQSSTQKELGDRSMFEHVWTLKETLKSYEPDRIDSDPTEIIVTGV